MGNVAKAFFDINGSWTAPAGVTSVRVVAQQNPNPVFTTSGSAFSLNPFGTLYAWGANASGQLGTGDTTSRNSPTLVVGGITFAQIYAGTQSNSVFGISKNGTLYAWGGNANGQLGLGDVTPRSSPVQVLGGLTFSSIYVDDDNTNVAVFGLTPSGVGYAWGDNTSGRLGIGNTTAQSSPIAIVGGLKFTKFFGDNNDDFTFGMDTSGVLWSWGANGTGYLGDGTTTSRSSPVKVVGNLTFKSLTTFESGTIALTDAGVAWAWGQNQSGALGDGTNTNRSSPVQVLGGLSFSKVVGGSSVLGLTTTGAAYGWGANSNGQLGTNDTTPRSSPVAVVGGLTFSDISTLSTLSMYGVTAAGAMYAWGINSNGKLGIGNTTDRSSPVAVVGGLTFSVAPFCNNGAQVANRIHAYDNTGQLYGWGINTSGVLGDETTIAKSSPVLVHGGFAAGLQPLITTSTITVVPGTTYTINMQQPLPTFGLNTIANFIPTSVTVFFEE